MKSMLIVNDSCLKKTAWNRNKTKYSHFSLIKAKSKRVVEEIQQLIIV